MAFGNELNTNHAKLQTPFNCSNPTVSKRTGITYLLVLDPVVEFDEAKIGKPTIETIMSKYGFKERP
jgi:hypothetical protein